MNMNIGHLEEDTDASSEGTPPPPLEPAVDDSDDDSNAPRRRVVAPNRRAEVAALMAAAGWPPGVPYPFGEQLQQYINGGGMGVFFSIPGSAVSHLMDQGVMETRGAVYEQLDMIPGYRPLPLFGIGSCLKVGLILSVNAYADGASIHEYVAFYLRVFTTIIYSDIRQVGAIEAQIRVDYTGRGSTEVRIRQYDARRRT